MTILYGPIHAVGTTSSALMMVAQSPPRPVRILIVDDHEVIRAGLAALLRPNWTICGEAVGGDQAIEQAKKLKPELVILDISMPGIGGVAVARAIRHLSPKTKIVFYSFHENKTIADLAKTVGADAFVTKRRPTSELLETIRHLVEAG